MKTIKKEEVETFQRNAIQYYQLQTSGEPTFLMKIYGLYGYIADGRECTVIIMKNVLPTCGKLKELYDFKGSSYNREVTANFCQFFLLVFYSVYFMISI